MTRSLHTRKYALFREALLQARESKGITQVELAERLSLPQSFVSKVETGERRLDVVEFLDYCAALGVDPLKLLRKFLT